MGEDGGGSETNTQLYEVVHKRLLQGVYRDWTLRTTVGRKALKGAVSTSISN